jgi:hypothetical protein
MSFNAIDLNQSYSTLDKPNIILPLSASLIKKLISVQSWYGNMLKEETNDPVKVVYSNQMVQPF